MNILFLTISRIIDLASRGIYSDLIRKFRDEGHNVYVVTPSERRYREKRGFFVDGRIAFLRVKTPNIQKTNIIEKGISTLFIDILFLKAIKRNCGCIRFDLIIFSTPPITFSHVIKFIKNRDSAITYLLLKDIFPQNSIDLGYFKADGLLHKYFVRVEKRLYELSDFIGCMSPANIEYILKHNPEINPEKIEFNPNSIDPVEFKITRKESISIRKKYKIPEQSTVFIYGGNLGKPQGIDFIIDFLDFHVSDFKFFFIVAGSGTEYGQLIKWRNKRNPRNALVLSNLPKEEYDILLKACDVGLIFLDKRFTIPNFPSRLLSYLEHKMPVIAATDMHTDLGKIIEDNQFGYWSEAGDMQRINQNIQKLAQNPTLRKRMGINGYNYLIKNYTVNRTYQIIMDHFSN